MRKRFDEELENLNTELITMGALCEEAISAASNALRDGRDTDIKKAIELEEEIDQKEREIEAICMKLLLRQQPVARDLRLISSALKMISDMERIGDQAADIAEICQYIKERDISSKIHILDMAEATKKMVTGSIDSFVKRDLEMAKAVIDYDDVVDDLFNKVRFELIGLISQSAEKAALCMDLLMIAKYYERLGDHATNIAEWVVYALTGTYVVWKQDK